MPKYKLTLTREEIAALDHADLLAHLDEKTKRDIYKMTLSPFTESPDKLPTESTGQYRQRMREAQEVDEVEFARAFRANLENALYSSTNRRTMKLIEGMANAPLDPDEAERMAKNQRYREQRDAQADREHGRIIGAAVGSWRNDGTDTPLNDPAPAAPPTATRKSGK
jgi:hypothetical protein